MAFISCIGITVYLFFILPIWATRVSTSAAALHLESLRNTPPPHYDSSPLNSTLPKVLNITDSERRNASSLDWDSIIPPFHNFLNGTYGRVNRPDKEVFHFSPENLANSAVHAWYAAWTRERQSHPKWKELGEVGMFAYDFLNTQDYFCDLSVSHCMKEPNEIHIQQWWPGPENRALAQRIYLQVFMFSELHNIKREQLDAFAVAHSFFSDYSFDIVSTFTKQVDQKRVMACNIIHKMVDLAVQIGMNMATCGAGDISKALSARDGIFQILSTDLLDGPFKAKTLKSVQGVLQSKDRDATKDAASFNWFKTTQDQYMSTTNRFMQEKFPIPEHGSESTDTSTQDQLHLDPGIAADWMCSQFEGDRQNYNEANARVLNRIIGNFFAGTRKQIQTLYSKTYNGWIAEPGMPSMMSIDFAMQDWPPLHGPDSKHNPLTDVAGYEEHVMSQSLRHLLSRTMSDDNTYLYCMHIPDAQAQCNIVPKENDPDWWKDYRATQICPRPVEDPTLLCSAARWYHATTWGSHVGLMPGIRQIEKWNSDRFHLTVKGLLQESYETYVLYRNNFNNIDWTSHLSNSPVFGIPTCVNDELHLHDGNPIHNSYFRKHASHLQFPFRCGDWRANESAGFMEAMNLGPGSRIHAQIEGIPGTRHPNELFWDRIPRLLDERNITAVSHYLNLCANAVRLPEWSDRHGDSWIINQWRPQIGIDQDCELMLNATRDMDEFHANEWFCGKGATHTVFQRQRDHHTLPQTLWEKPSHKKMCDDWRKKG
ncbi:hypothetical protein EG329_013498 [Mollisiaceae sp. DMI_Dod_QoI]|nr:hypothetical protein EG329_013498 [Helotiales sp. DMI_Dod_QoI]